MLWTVDGLLVGLAVGFAFNKSSVWLLLTAPIVVLTLIVVWPTIRALAADRVRRVRTLRSMLVLVMAIMAIALLASNSILAVPFALAVLMVFVLVAQLNEHSQPSSKGGHDVGK
jgi:cytochrome bd-type quinol oxidase subunit 2